MCTETPLEYSQVVVSRGETVSLLCNTSADVMWTYDTNDGYVDYVYWNEQIDDDKPHLSVNVTEDDFSCLVISHVLFSDGGLYDCYDNSGVRVVGYQVTVDGMNYFVNTANFQNQYVNIEITMLKFVTTQ